ncbi:COL19A1 isoform 2, partial [Pan troglodytes]
GPPGIQGIHQTLGGYYNKDNKGNDEHEAGGLKGDKV